MNSQRLDKIIASQLNISRSEARTDIRRGFVEVNGQVVRDPSKAFSPTENEILYKGQVISFKEFIYLVLNKPKGVLSASTDKNRETVIDLVPKHLARQNLSPVGRLDKDTTGLLLITDDGQFSHKVISPKSDIKKVYDVVLDGPIPLSASEDFERGIILADGTRCLPAKLEILAENRALVEIREGKYHQVKRMFGVLDLGVVELKRLKVGGFSLPDDLREGECRELTETEIRSILY